MTSYPLLHLRHIVADHFFGFQPLAHLAFQQIVERDVLPVVQRRHANRRGNAHRVRRARQIRPGGRHDFGYVIVSEERQVLGTRSFCERPLSAEDAGDVYVSGVASAAAERTGRAVSGSFAPERTADGGSQIRGWVVVYVGVGDCDLLRVRRE